MIELVVFDCDGVLIDSEAIGARVEAAYFTSIGYPIDAVTMVRRFAGRSSVDMNAEIEAALGTPLPQDHDERMRKALGAAFATELRPMPGIHDLLGRLPFKRCVASSSGPERLRLTLGLTDLWDRFAPDVFSAAMVANGKPAPDLFLLAAQRMGTRPEACVVVEDSVFGIEAAARAGMTAIGFTGGSHVLPDHAACLRAAGARQVIADLAELPRCIGEVMARRL